MALKMECPHCKKTLNVSDKAAGTTAPCPACGKAVTVQLPERAAAQAGSPESSRRATPAGQVPRDGGAPPPVGIPPVPGAERAREAATSRSASVRLDGASSPILKQGTELLGPSILSGLNDSLPGLKEMRLPSPPSAAPRKRPAMLVWIVFYWGVSSVACLIMGLGLVWAGGFAGGAMGSLPGSLSSVPMAFAVELLTFAGLLLFHLGIVTAMACYGLWTYRRWGLTMAKVLAIMFAISNAIWLVVALVIRTSILTSLANSVVAAVMLIYLLGSAPNVSERLQEAWSRVQRSNGPTWEGYE